MSARGPGRVNLIGEHTDYNEGLCLPFAVERGVTVHAGAGAPGWVEAHARDLGERERFAIGRAARPPQPEGGWRAFVRGVVAELALDLPGVRLEIEGDLPRGAGLASSAALSAALCLALLGLAGADEPDRRELARLCSRVEHDWVGAETGLLDQLACLLGREGEALLLDCRDLSVRPVPLRLGDWRLVVLDSGARHEHSGSGYNERRRECEEAARQAGAASLREVTTERAARLPEPLRRRALHVIGENERVLDAARAMEAGDQAALAALLDASHASLRDLYEVSVPEVERAVARLKEHGATGARIMGGGFGGAVLALFPPGATPPAEALEVAPAAGARLL